MTSILELGHVSKTYGEGATSVAALRAVSLQVSGGELVAIMGPSGSGKSTLLSIAGTLEEPSEGSVVICGANVAALAARERSRLLRRTIGFVFQSYNLLPGLTAVENVALPLELDGTRRRAAHRVARHALQALGLGERLEHFPDELSGGESQRVAIARAAVGERRLVLADEPTGALDSVSGEGVMRLLRAACGTGVAVVFVTHDAQLASCADRVVSMRDGRIVDDAGDVREPAVREAEVGRR
jgi:putative ABC transport system ATP-binding protein